MARLRGVWFLFGAVTLFVSSSAGAEAPTVQDFLALMKLSPAEIAQAQAGEIIEKTAKGSNERELVAVMAFMIPNVQPDDIVTRGKGGLLDQVADSTISFSILPEAPTVQDFAKLELRPEDVSGFAKAKAGEDFNFSDAELATLHKLGPNPSAGQVKQIIDALLLGRLQAYKAKGLAGIAPYQRSDDEVRSAADDLRAASLASKGVEKIAPAAYKLLLDYPSSIPPGTQETFRWSYIDAHGEPTIVLTQNLYIPDGGVWLVVQRQFYVSGGYNCEQALAAIVPVKEGTAVFYINRTSTDQVMGFGGGAKRSIGSSVLASQLKALVSKASKVVEGK
jgi:hypothetical protein